MLLIAVFIILIVILYAIANIILTTIAIENGDTIQNILNEQDFGLGKIGVNLMYWPTFIVLYIRSLRPVNTNYSFEEEVEE
jgi:hypothetical protein